MTQQQEVTIQNDEAKIGAAGFYIGDRFGGWNFTQQQAQKYSRLLPVSGFTTVDFAAGYNFKKIAIMVKVFNVYNYYVHENYSINPIAPGQFISTISLKL